MPLSFFTVGLTDLGLFAIALLLAIPVLVLFGECLAAFWFSKDEKEPVAQSAPSTAILMPAHNEAAVIRPVLEGLLSQLSEQDRVVVIADNCSDETAAIARSTGVTVIERQDRDRRGKGYALDFGLQFLADHPPEVVVMMDADCQVQPGTISRITRQAIATQRPVQAIYLMERPAQPEPKDALSSLAFLVKNWVRPLGLKQLNLPCLLTGTGMAFPWATLQGVSLASGNIVEDMQMAVDLAIDGHPAFLCPNTKVIGILPQQEQVAKTQRTRWEHGHLKTALTQIPRLVKAAVRQGRVDLLAIALDLSVPPLSLLVVLWVISCIAALLGGWFIGNWLPEMLLLGEGLLIVLAIALAWVKFGRDLPFKTLLSIPFYVIWKIPLYLAFLVNPQTKWVRTERD
ncbi:MAG: glycosyltransferase family 2 protein [Oculatellaceae cyanobacterium Prado106]|nr:glycosyltransferase family 2 protein [Oculatellaceae cyanobacterium Prado106]